ncbi:Brisc Complex Subunit Abraxas 2 [Manis pentadactyla]|nr:Brisc Complex Subunit Abraxas 2 [Manis pentadactyla]
MHSKAKNRVQLIRHSTGERKLFPPRRESVGSLLLEEDTGWPQQTEVAEYPRAKDKGNNVFFENHTPL